MIDNRPKNKVDAISSLRPNSDWTLVGDVLTWLDKSQTQPTDAEIDAEVKRLQADYDSKQYQRDRAAEYPSWEDQLDKIYHSGLDAWKADIKAIKDKYPKP